LIPTVPARADHDDTDQLPVQDAHLDAGPTSQIPQARLGIGAPLEGGPIEAYAIERLGLGWYLNWTVEVNPRRPDGVEFWQMIRLAGETSGDKPAYRPDAATIRAAARANPGSTWLIGNEPDVAWQDDATPERYAELYHELYELLKATDPTCQIAIAGVSQATPLRLAYLERVLEVYQTRYGTPIPVDVWNIHGFVLREERDSWGVGIPPGFDADTGVLYEIEDHDSLELFREQIVAFRRWMADHGQRDRPLVLSEFGILMPEDYGFGSAQVEAFMRATFDYLNNAADEEIGYPPDDNHLVQWWAWYSLADKTYPTGSLFDPETKAITDLGKTFAQFSVSTDKDE
jgi:hypothetical protein